MDAKEERAFAVETAIAEDGIVVVRPGAAGIALEELHDRLACAPPNRTCRRMDIGVARRHRVRPR